MPYLLDSAPGQRYRIEQWAPYLRDEGIDVTFLPFETPLLNRLMRDRGHVWAKSLAVLSRMASRTADIRAARDYDVVFIHREAALIGPPVMERAILARGTPVIYDFDDAIYLLPMASRNGAFNRLRMPGKTRTLCRIADAVTVGSPHLSEYAVRAGGKVTLMPTTIDTRLYTAPPREESPVPVIGWSGSVTTAPYLEIVRGALRRLARDHRFRMMVIGAPWEDSELDVINVPWRSESEVADVSRIDVGLMPLPDNPWARGKCAAKALQYMALGIPAVVSPIGVNAEIVLDQVNGATAGTEDEWVTKLASLLRDPELRKRLGDAGRRTVHESFSAVKHAPRLASLMREVAAARAKGKR